MNEVLARELEHNKELLAIERGRNVEIRFVPPKEDVEPWEPIGGYKNLRTKIAEAEAASRKKIQDADQEREAVGKDATSSSQ